MPKSLALSRVAGTTISNPDVMCSALPSFNLCTFSLTYVTPDLIILYVLLFYISHIDFFFFEVEPFSILSG